MTPVDVNRKEYGGLLLPKNYPSPMYSSQNWSTGTKSPPPEYPTSYF